MQMYADMSSKTLFGAGLRTTLIATPKWLERLFDASMATTFR
jgi:hypothetical protein